MRILPYYVLHTFINSIKKLFKTWVAIVIAICFGFGVLGGIIGAAVGMAVENSADSSYEEVVEEEEDFAEEEFEMTPEERQGMLSFISGIVVLISLSVILFSIYGGDKNGSKIFSMSDVNFLFASPMPPQSVLMFKTILQMGIAIVSSIYLLFQLPNLVLNLGLSVLTCICIFIAYAFLLYFSRLASVVTYTVTSTKLKLKPLVRPFVIAVFALLIALYAALVYIAKMSYLEAFSAIFSNGVTKYIPVFGWLAGFVMASVDGSLIEIIIFFLLLVAASIILTVLIWKIKADFYEDALTGAGELQEKLEAAQSGATQKRKKDRSEKIRRNLEFKSEGAAIFFEKTMYNRRRFSKFGFLSNTAITYANLTLAATLGVKLLFHAETILPIGFILLVSVFFRNLANPLADEMSRDYLYTVPESAYKKMWFCLLGTVYETALDLVPVYILTAFFLPEQSLRLLIWFVLWVSLDFFCSSVGLFVEFIMPSSIVLSIKSMFAVFIRMFAIVPGLILAIIAAVANQPLFLIITIALNLILGGILSSISPIFLHTGKK